MEIISELLAIWAPSLIAILGIVITIIKGLGKTNEVIENFRSDKTLSEINKKLTELTSENKELVRCNKLLLEQITKIKDYADFKGV